MFKNKRQNVDQSSIDIDVTYQTIVLPSYTFHSLLVFNLIFNSIFSSRFSSRGNTWDLIAVNSTKLQNMKQYTKYDLINNWLIYLIVIKLRRN